LKGRGFSRAVSVAKSMAALAAEVISEKKSSDSVLHRRHRRSDVIRRHSHCS
jgi:hypothetical protein